MTTDTPGWPRYHEGMGLSPVINVSGTMTSLGASIVVPEARAAVAAILSQFVSVNELQRKASTAIARATGAEAGCVTASSGAGITIAIAGAMTGADPAKVQQLPDATGMKDEVAIQLGHLCDYGAPIDQAIRLAGARVRPVGQSTQALDHQLAGALSERTAAALYVVSHHVVDYGQIPLKRFVEICHAHGVPVIVDAASEYDLTGFLAAGADIVIYSAHKFLGGPTAGILAGAKTLIRAAYMQNIGIGRGMKVGKEGIAGTIAALDAWKTRDHARIRARERAALELWQGVLAGHPGIAAKIVPDPTGNPLDRLQVDVEATRAGASALAIAAALATGDPPVIVRDDEIDRNYFQLDPCNLHEGQAGIVRDRLGAVIADAAAGRLAEPDPNTARNGAIESLRIWPD